MKRFHCAMSCLFACALALIVGVGCKRSESGPAPEGEGELSKGVKLEAGGEPIDIEVGHLVPRVCDWNNDGRKDLIVGQFSGGAIRLYLNQGTDAAPVFGESSFLHAGGKPIRLDAG